MRRLRSVVAALVLGIAASASGAAQDVAGRVGPAAEARWAPPLVLPPLSAAVSPGVEAPSVPKQFHYVVVGAGDVVSKFYSPAFRDLKAKYAGKSDIAVTFIDASDFWKHDEKAAAKAQSIIAELKSWGATVLDASDEQGRADIAALRPDATIVAVPDFLHVDKTMEWLNHPGAPRHIYVEKPLDRNRGKGNALLRRIGYDSDRVLVLDHYAARLLPTSRQLADMASHLGGGIKSFAYYFLEDHSGDDPSYAASVERDGAIEREQRVRALDGGMVLDGLPHLFPLLKYFADVERIHVTGVRAAQYTGVDGDPDKRTEIKAETFAEVRLDLFRRPSISGPAVVAADGLIKGVAYVGKGVRGVKALGPEFDRNAKLLDVVGLNGNSIRFDLRSISPDGRHARAYFRDAAGKEISSFPLYAKPYAVLFERILLDVNDALRVYEAERILEAIERIVDPIQIKGVLDTYEGGLKGKRASLYLEEIAAKVPYFFRHGN